MLSLTRHCTPRLRSSLNRSSFFRSHSSAVSDFRRFGHLEADIDPLGLLKRHSPELAAYEGDAAAASLRSIYCGAMGVEFEHADTSEEREWWATRLETSLGSVSPFEASVAQQKNASFLLTQADVFEGFLQKKYPTLKRYSGEGTESLLPALDALFSAAAAASCEDVVVGMAHRGRLALLVSSIFQYPARRLFHKLTGLDDIAADVQGLDDVSSHIATSIDKVYGVGGARQRRVHLSLLHNPSHLEAVNAVAAGKARAKRDAAATAAAGARPTALCLQVHGDAAVYGQGIVAEMYGMSKLPGYEVGGTIHVITNNQVGFTATQGVSRSSLYASDAAKMVGAPVLHVNAERMKEVLLAAQLAVEYRAKFSKDVVIDLIGYRRHGHNELDEPRFTQPVMYSAISARPSFSELYAQQLAEGGVQTREQHATVVARLTSHLEAEFAASKTDFTASSGTTGKRDPAKPGHHIVGDASAFGGKWAGMRQASIADLSTKSSTEAATSTGTDLEALRAIARASVTLPEGVAVHDRLVRGHIQPRLAAVAAAKEAPETARVIDWATAEALALGRALAGGYDVRFSGQDSQRGTFSHRHAVMVDQKTGGSCTPLNEAPLPQGLPPIQVGAAVASSATSRGKLHIFSSLLSEFGVLGFEYGYSLESPAALVLWEAQFGDFANGAQIIIDQFLATGETKWLRQSGLVLLLPHGFDGAGPEHSSARIERFLQLVNTQALTREGGRGASATDKSLSESSNLIIASPTTPANYYHILMRQLSRPFRKPLVLIAPKTLLRDPAARSPLSAFAPGTRFEPVLGEDAAAVAATAASLPPPPAKVERLLLCSGKIHLELAAKRASLPPAKGSGGAGGGAAVTGIARLEELAPFPLESLQRHLAAHPALKEVVWVQEEPANAGAWQFVEAHLAPSLAKLGLPPLRYVGRPALAAVAVGLSKYNKAQQDALLAAAFA